MQTLYEWDFRGGKMTDLEVEHTLARNAEEFAPGVHDISFMRKLLLGILAKRAQVDDIIEKAAPDWSIDKIAIIDRNILRIGLYELLFEDRAQVPAKVAINEAIELSKTYGGETSSKFINGVLGAVYKELGEPGKDEISKKKNPPELVDPKTLPVDKLGGAVVYAKDGKDVFLGLVHDIFGHWTLSKGHYADGEKDEQAIMRIVREEIGLPVTVGELLGENEYVASHPEKGKLLKQVKYFLAEAPYQEIALQKKGGLDDAQWFRFADILNLNLYDDMIPVITKAVEILLGKK